jgi:hypothetical protein
MFNQDLVFPVFSLSAKRGLQKVLTKGAKKLK